MWVRKTQLRRLDYLWSEVNVKHSSFSGLQGAAMMRIPVWVCACGMCITSLCPTHRSTPCGCMWTVLLRTLTTQSWLWCVSRKRCYPGRFHCSSKDCKYVFPQTTSRHRFLSVAQILTGLCLSEMRNLTFGMLACGACSVQTLVVVHTLCVLLISIPFEVHMRTLPRFVAPRRTFTIVILFRIK